MGRGERSSWYLAEGDEVARGLRAQRHLGGGKRFEAYLASEGPGGALRVIKVLRPTLVDDPRSLRRLAAEVDALERMEHPGVVRMLWAELGGERPHIALAHVAGPRLSSLVRRAGPLPSIRLRALGHGLASAAGHLAGRGIAHLDVKPSNVIMSERPTLIDLSVARPLAACSALRTHVGTDAYMAPEQCVPQELGAPGPASDVWGIGATLLRAATGARPFRKGERESKVPSERWPQLTEPHAPLPRDLDSAVAAAIGGCLRFDPAARPSATELEAMLAPATGTGTP